MKKRNNTKKIKMKKQKNFIIMNLSYPLKHIIYSQRYGFLHDTHIRIKNCFLLLHVYYKFITCSFKEIYFIYDACLLLSNIYVLCLCICNAYCIVFVNRKKGKGYLANIEIITDQRHLIYI